MRFRGLMDCDKRFKSAHQVAVLHYYGAERDAYPQGDPDYDSSHKEGLVCFIYELMRNLIKLLETQKSHCKLCSNKDKVNINI